mmetsp:Transcript_48593/g.141539  ORF Transcript_48593/g.141539 Transcript_48593/m.141539 type:complete len:289 (-) Transcript_48593:771-1637(-)
MISRTLALNIGWAAWELSTKPCAPTSSMEAGSPIRPWERALPPSEVSQSMPESRPFSGGGPGPPFASKPMLPPPSPAPFPHAPGSFMPKPPPWSLMPKPWSFMLKPPPPKPRSSACGVVLRLREVLAERESPCMAKSAAVSRMLPKKSYKSCGRPAPGGGNGRPARTFRTRCRAATNSAKVKRPARLTSANSTICANTSLSKPDRRNSPDTSSRATVSDSGPAIRWNTRAYFRQSLGDGKRRGLPDERLRLADRDEPCLASSGAGGAPRKEAMSWTASPDDGSRCIGC